MKIINVKPTQIHAHFKWNVYSEEIMGKLGFKMISLKLALTKENWLMVMADWKMDVDSYKVKYPVENGTGSSFGGDQNESNYVEFFFREIEADKKSYRADYSDIERTYNGFGKVGFTIGIKTKMGVDCKKMRLGYDFAYSVNNKYGVICYFSPDNFGEIKEVLEDFPEDSV